MHCVMSMLWRSVGVNLNNDIVTDIADETGELAAALTEQYLGYAEMGNFESMEPGMVDVSFALLLR